MGNPGQESPYFYSLLPASSSRGYKGREWRMGCSGAHLPVARRLKVLVMLSAQRVWRR